MRNKLPQIPHSSNSREPRPAIPPAASPSYGQFIAAAGASNRPAPPNTIDAAAVHSRPCDFRRAMKNRVSTRRLGRNGSHRVAMLRNLVTALVQHGRIRTTVPKAKEAQALADNVVTWAKYGDNRYRQRLNGFLRTPEAAKLAVDVLAPRYA